MAIGARPLRRSGDDSRWQFRVASAARDPVLVVVAALVQLDQLQLAAGVLILTQFVYDAENSYDFEGAKGKYVSITVRIIATSRKQLDSINTDLQKSPLVSYLL